LAGTATTYKKITSSASNHPIKNKTNPLIRGSNTFKELEAVGAGPHLRQLQQRAAPSRQVLRAHKEHTTRSHRTGFDPSGGKANGERRARDASYVGVVGALLVHGLGVLAGHLEEEQPLRIAHPSHLHGGRGRGSSLRRRDPIRGLGF